ncbi:MAG: hypothetical protein WCA07_03075 [Gloeobacterales cyanobacterium]
MWVVILEKQVIRSDIVCSSCLLANSQGHPRYDNGRLRCGRLSQTLPEAISQYQCTMGFQLAQTLEATGEPS